jgi:sugar/nucleoside kinase (ribokinase family)
MLYLDELPEPRPQTLFAARSYETVGSSGAGKALNLRHLGWQVRLWAALGTDEYGRKVRAFLGDAGVELTTVDDPAGTMRHVNLMDGSGDRISIFASSGSRHLEVDHHAMRQQMADADLVAVTIFDHCRGFLPIAAELGIPLWIDIHDYDGANPYHRDFIEAATYLQLSTTALRDWRAFAEARIRSGAELVVCTHGAAGASAYTADGWCDIATEPAQPVDSNGAGDGFFAGFASALLHGDAVAVALQAGAEAAREAVRSPDLAPRS